MAKFVLVSPTGDTYQTNDKAEATRLKTAHGYADAIPAEVRKPIRQKAEKKPDES